MAIPTFQDLQVIAGDNLIEVFTITQSGVAVDLSGHTITALGRRGFEDSENLFSVSIVDSGQSDFANGVIEFAVTDSDTARLPRVSLYQIESNNGGVITTLVRGRISTLPDIA